MKPGCKQTEVGVIPEDWESGALEKFWSVTDCKHVTATFVFSGYPLASIQQVQSRFVDLSSANQTTEEFYRLLISGGRKPQPDDLIISRNATVGEMARVAEWHPPFAMGQDVCLLRRKQLDFSSGFMQAVFQSGIIAAQLRDMMVGSTFKRVNVQQIKGLNVPMPPAAEQEAIAGALSDADALIDSLEQLIAKKRLLKQGAMQDLLTGKKRLPGFKGEWEKTTLLRLADGKKELFDDGDWIEAEHITTKGIRLIQTGNIGVGRFEEKEIKKYIFEKSFISLRCKELRKGDLLICRLAEPAGRACVLPDIGEERIVTSVDVTIFRPPESAADRVFLANLFSTSSWFKEVGDQSGGTTHKRISRGALGRLEITIPPLPEQTAIAAILSDMDAGIAALEAKLAKARQVKQGMMQELLTGRTRLI